MPALNRYSLNRYSLNRYIRPMSGWWRRNPFYLWYMLREASSVFITAYALVLLWGLYCLTQGAAAYAGWLAALGSPWSIAFHAVTALLVVYHAWTWFKVMPKTMPFIRTGGKRVSDAAITICGVSAAAVLSLLLFALLWGVAR